MLMNETAEWMEEKDELESLLGSGWRWRMRRARVK